MICALAMKVYIKQQIKDSSTTQYVLLIILFLYLLNNEAH